MFVLFVNLLCVCFSFLRVLTLKCWLINAIWYKMIHEVCDIKKQTNYILTWQYLFWSYIAFIYWFVICLLVFLLESTQMDTTKRLLCRPLDYCIIDVLYGTRTCARQKQLNIYNLGLYMEPALRHEYWIRIDIEYHLNSIFEKLSL